MRLERTIKNIIRSSFIVALLFISVSILAQSKVKYESTQSNDTLTLAKQFINNGKFIKAEKLLKYLVEHNKNDLDLQWLHAQTAYWAKHYKTFNNSYTKAIDQFPTNYYLRLDYALKLVENGDIKKALPLLEMYKNYDSTNNDWKLAFAKIQYWQGNYMEALQIIDSESLVNEKQKEVLQLKQELLTAKSTWLSLNCNYLSDDQPLKVIAPKLEAGTFFNQRLSPYISITAPGFQTSSDTKSAGTIHIGNKLSFIKAGITLNANGGFIQMPDKTKSWIGNVDITKTSFKYLKLNAQVAYQPYLITVSSIANTTIPYHHLFSAGWNNLNSWYGKLTGSIDRFTNDDNYIYNFNGWLFAPPIKFSLLQLRIGYAYGFSSSKENRYTSKESLSNIVSNYPSANTNIIGIYNPYFTPGNQRFHAALLNISCKPSQRLSIGASLNIGFWGTTENPYLFLDKNNNGEMYIHRDYSKISFHPAELSTFIICQLTKKISAKADYIFLRNNFYTSHSAGITLKVNFWNDKK